jgi:putative transposase
MPNYRRVKIKGGTYFFTLITHNRNKLFASSKTRELFLEALEHVRIYHPFTLIAYCILPDHIHLLIKLPEDDDNFSTRISEIKKRFTKQYRAKNNISQSKNSLVKQQNISLWKDRFWEHYIRDENDLSRHIEYIHFNPVKHGLVNQTKDWRASSFFDYVQKGYFDSDWGQGETKRIRVIDRIRLYQ